MKGNVYTRQKCPVCKGRMVFDWRRENCFCEKCNIPASSGYFVGFGREVKDKRFNDPRAAAQFLNGLRFETAKGTFDARDYQADNPLGFANQVIKWLSVKKDQVGPSHYRNLKNYMTKATKAWGNENVKAIKYAQIEDFLFDKKVVKNDKTRSNIKSCLSDFWKWLKKREGIPVPEMPDCKFELGWRHYTDWETQGRIVKEIKRLTYHVNKKVWFGIELLCSYLELRPDDLRRITEGDFDGAAITIHKPTKKKNKFKVVQLTPEHIDTWKQLKSESPGLPHLPFFRHPAGISGCKAETVFGNKYLYKWWKKACQNLGVKDLDLYGGTRHTGTTELARIVGQVKTKKATGHDTNKAFDRYCQAKDDTAFEMAKVIHRQRGGGEVVRLRKVE